MVVRSMTERHRMNIGPGLRRFDVWLRELGRTSTTGYRWRKRGWIKTVNIAGRCYITDTELQDFIRRSEQGEFFSRTLEAATTASIKHGIRESFKKGRASRFTNVCRLDS